MENSREVYRSPFGARYASRQMQYLFSDDMKFKTWRRLWIALARAEKELGLPITDRQIEELEAHAQEINYAEAEAREKECRHDVMAHIYAYGLQCPEAAGIIHLGATSCYVGDNTDVIIMKQALELVRRKLLSVIGLLADFAMQHRSLACLAYTHLQPAQLTTVGKRATLWIHDLMLDVQEVQYRMDNLKLLGQKGTTGTQASFVDLFAGDDDKIGLLEEKIAAQMGFASCVPVSGQTYTRKYDSFVLATLAGVAQSASKFSNDMRLLQNFKEMEEPFETSQIGSSAMPYKRNPMRCERITSLARHVICDSLNPAFTAATQWFERTLDDSANKRIAVAEAFLGIDSILNLMLNVCDGLVVYPEVIRRRVMSELPFMATENIMMEAVKRGGDRQALHEKLRVHSQAAAGRVKREGAANDLMDRIAQDADFGLERAALEKLLKPEAFTGRASQQTRAYIEQQVRPLLCANEAVLGETAEIFV